MEKPLILITNDDGIYSPGLKAAAESVAHLGELLIVAPQSAQTGLGRSVPSGPDIGIIESVALKINGSSHPAYAINGSPALAVAHAVMELAPRKPILCVSGINYGENIGAGISASGTVGATFEADSLSIPAIAVSFEANINIWRSGTYAELNWDAAMYFTAYFAQKTLLRGLPREIAALNVNVPASATRDTPIRVTVQSRQNYFDWAEVEHGGRDFTKGFRLKVVLKIDDTTLEPNSDIQAFVRDRVVSVTPLTWDLTAKTNLEEWYTNFSR